MSEDRNTYPFEPSSTNMPVLGISRLRSATAVTNPPPFLKSDVLKSFPRFLTEMAMPGAICGTPSSGADCFFLQKRQEGPEDGLRASYRRLSHNVASQGHRKMSIYRCTLGASARVETRGDSQSRQ